MNLSFGASPKSRPSAALTWQHQASPATSTTTRAWRWTSAGNISPFLFCRFLSILTSVSSCLHVLIWQRDEQSDKERWQHLADLADFALAMKVTLMNINYQSFNNFMLRIGTCQFSNLCPAKVQMKWKWKTGKSQGFALQVNSLSSEKNFSFATSKAIQTCNKKHVLCVFV